MEYKTAIDLIIENNQIAVLYEDGTTHIIHDTIKKDLIDLWNNSGKKQKGKAVKNKKDALTMKRESLIKALERILKIYKGSPIFIRNFGDMIFIGQRYEDFGIKLNNHAYGLNISNGVYSLESFIDYLKEGFDMIPLEEDDFIIDERLILAMNLSIDIDESDRSGYIYTHSDSFHIKTNFTELYDFSSSEERKCLNGLNFNFKQSRIEATNGHVMGYMKYPSMLDDSLELDVILPKHACKIIDALGYSEFNCNVIKRELKDCYARYLLNFKNDDIELCFLTIDGTYPHIDRIIPSFNGIDEQYKFELNLNDADIQRIKTYCKNKTKIITCQGDKLIAMNENNSTVIKNITNLRNELVDGVRFNFEYMVAIQKFYGKDVILNYTAEYKSPVKPVKIVSDDVSKFVILMPMKK